MNRERIAAMAVNVARSVTGADEDKALANVDGDAAHPPHLASGMLPWARI